MELLIDGMLYAVLAALALEGSGFGARLGSGSPEAFGGTEGDPRLQGVRLRISLKGGILL